MVEKEVVRLRNLIEADFHFYVPKTRSAVDAPWVKSIMSNPLALTRPSSHTSAGPSKVASKSIPAFLNKLYNMVDDPSTDSLIKWSDNGDSFLVLDHERFAHEVLGRWFKHKNFSSFVRQLNMYGFHKIPHLQQGVLRNDSDTEVWNFENANFTRGQPDLLCLIQRKKQMPNLNGTGGLGGDGDEDSDDNKPSTAGPSRARVNAGGTVVDVNSIINGIAAIKRHQTAISADLKNLQQSNQHLWQEALYARERHQKHQDTINRILKFLAGVFGTSAPTSNKDDRESPRSVSVVPVRKARLMIEDGSKRFGDKISEVEGDRSFDDLDLPLDIETGEPLHSSGT
ncbi:hypothetical protein SISNIDRAFT_11776 [Sistotremastrum niveocremeum HHB9708]|uniref:HSF-type DNA-binding domain-containing protein n=1 Tax=Sistotremastrum niveocremeum HHB9708 TaxID=1314777 RepID=A0A165AJH0_9AGAM|nr:hypothetical protein SISNIDRAFT_11776 [Sistotremastrum niveocremeum HHB9708]